MRRARPEVGDLSSRGFLIAALVGGVLVGSAAGASGPFVYPQKGQSQAQQDQDRGACDRWAREQTGMEPNAPAPSGHRGGTMIGGLAGRRRGKQEPQAAASEQQSTYARAFSACMEGRGYTVR